MPDTIQDLLSRHILRVFDDEFQIEGLAKLVLGPDVQLPGVSDVPDLSQAPLGQVDGVRTDRFSVVEAHVDRRRLVQPAEGHAADEAHQLLRRVGLLPGQPPLGLLPEADSRAAADSGIKAVHS